MNVEASQTATAADKLAQELERIEKEGATHD